MGVRPVTWASHVGVWELGSVQEYYNDDFLWRSRSSLLFTWYVSSPRNVLSRYGYRLYIWIQFSEDKCHLYTKLNKWVFNADLNCHSLIVALWRWSGSEFQTVGVATRKLRPPIFVFVDGTRRSPRSAARKLVRPGMAANGTHNYIFEVDMTGAADAVKGQHGNLENNPLLDW